MKQFRRNRSGVLRSSQTNNPCLRDNDKQRQKRQDKSIVINGVVPRELAFMDFNLAAKVLAHRYTSSKEGKHGGEVLENKVAAAENHEGTQHADNSALHTAKWTGVNHL
jgi:hypothetical protein